MAALLRSPRWGSPTFIDWSALFSRQFAKIRKFFMFPWILLNYNRPVNEEFDKGLITGSMK